MIRLSKAFTQRPMFAQQRMPLVVEPASSARAAEAIGELSGEIDQLLAEFGALLFRGFRITSSADFSQFLSMISHHRSDYMYRSTPRTQVGQGIYTSTEYPPEQEIPLHNENAYQSSWPSKIAFCCIVPPDVGGETPIADMRQVTANLGPSLIDKFEARRVLYVRHYRPYVDIPWQTVFQTEDFKEVESYCASRGIRYRWISKDVLRTEQVCQGTIVHPRTGERMFFNQAHLFHVSSVGPTAMNALISVFGRDLLPRHAYFGDAGEICDADLEAVRAAFNSASLKFKWNQGDVLFLDNMQCAHGRRPYVGKRQILASLLDPISVAPVA